MIAFVFAREEGTTRRESGSVFYGTVRVKKWKLPRLRRELSPSLSRESLLVSPLAGGAFAERARRDVFFPSQLGSLGEVDFPQFAFDVKTQARVALGDGAEIRAGARVLVRRRELDPAAPQGFAVFRVIREDLVH